jgi:hypothetical protein
MQFMNRFNWIGQQQDGEKDNEIYLLCKNEMPNGTRCSLIYKKNTFENDTCPICGTYAAIDIYKEQKLDSSLNENKLHNLFFERVPQVYKEMNISIWNSLGPTAWKSAEPKEQVFLAFCMAFKEVSGRPTQSESDYWDAALAAETLIRSYLVENKIQIIKQEDFNLSDISDGMFSGTKVRALKANYGISLCGEVFEKHTGPECERKYQKAIKIAERLAMIGCSSQDNLPYFNAKDHLRSL